MSPKKSYIGQPPEIQPDLSQAVEFLNEGNYEKLAIVLAETRFSDESLDNQLAADILATVREICAACSQSRAEVNWHQIALEKAQQRESELKQRLAHLLSIAGGEPRTKAAISKSEDDGPDRSNPPSSRLSPNPAGFWRLVQNLIKRKEEMNFLCEEEQTGLNPLQPCLRDERSTEADFEREANSADLAIYCLGPFKVYRHGQCITNWSSHKSQEIFKFLVKNYGNATTKDKLMDIFWPDADPEAARRNLHQAIYSLRQTLRRGQTDFHPIQFENDCYSINPDLKVYLDYLEFDQYLLAGRQFEKSGQTAKAMAEYRIAEQLYRGDFLEESLYDNWINLPRQNYRNAYLDLADRLSEYLQREGLHSETIEICQKMLMVDNCDERAHARLMKSYQLQGEKLRALRQYQICAETLQRELDVSPSTEIRRLFEQINGRAVGSV